MKSKRRSAFIVGGGVALVAAAWFFCEPLREHITGSATLANDAPTPEVVADMIERAADPSAALLAVWNSGKIVHREAAVRSLSRVLPRDQPLSPQLDSLVLSAALDPDMNVREAALGELQNRRHRRLTALAAAQLPDVDPEVRLLGLTHLRSAEAKVGVPLVIPLLDDADLRVVGRAIKLLESWAGESFGVKLADTVQVENKQTGLKEFQADGTAKTMAAAERTREWWFRNRAEFPPVRLDVPAQAFAARQPIPAGDFRLAALDGRPVRLADFHGKVVLINFWTTWCTACVGEMTELIALQKRQDDHLVILGVSLDCVPDDHERNAAALKRVREKVARTVQARGINYTILLDEKNSVGGRFNGGELPTTVIVDAEGNVRRRFIGARSLPVFEALIAEASQPVRPAALPLPARQQPAKGEVSQREQGPTRAKN